MHLTLVESEGALYQSYGYRSPCWTSFLPEAVTSDCLHEAMHTERIMLHLQQGIAP
jgi:hypothetical protein